MAFSMTTVSVIPVFMSPGRCTRWLSPVAASKTIRAFPSCDFWHLSFCVSFCSHAWARVRRKIQQTLFTLAFLEYHWAVFEIFLQFLGSCQSTSVCLPVLLFFLNCAHFWVYMFMDWPSCISQDIYSMIDLIVKYSFLRLKNDLSDWMCKSKVTQLSFLSSDQYCGPNDVKRFQSPLVAFQ